MHFISLYIHIERWENVYWYLLSFTEECDDRTLVKYKTWGVFCFNDVRFSLSPPLIVVNNRFSKWCQNKKEQLHVHNAAHVFIEIFIHSQTLSAQQCSLLDWTSQGDDYKIRKQCPRFLVWQYKNCWISMIKNNCKIYGNDCWVKLCCSCHQVTTHSRLVLYLDYTKIMLVGNRFIYFY